MLFKIEASYNYENRIIQRRGLVVAIDAIDAVSKFTNCLSLSKDSMCTRIKVDPLPSNVYFL